MMDMKSMIARMDAIESKKVLKEDAAPVVEYKGGTDQEKIKNWQDHIKNFDNFPKAQDDARQAAKRAQPGAKFYKTDDKPKKEGMGSIARALMQDMGIEEEGDPAWYGPGGANLMTGEPTAPGTGNPYKDIKAWNQDRLNQRAANRGAAATQAAANANPEVYGYGGAPQAAAEPQAAAATQPAAGTQADAAFQQANTQAPAPAVTNPATDPNTNPGKPTTGSEMDTPAPAGITPASSGAASTQPPNRDTMPFDKAFADARAKGEKVFTWKGKQYAVKMANTQGAQSAQPQVAPSPQPAYNRAQDSQAASVASKVKPGTVQNVPKRPMVVGTPSAKVLQWDQLYGATHNPDGTPKVQSESKLEDDRILALIRDIRI